MIRTEIYVICDKCGYGEPIVTTDNCSYDIHVGERLGTCRKCNNKMLVVEFREILVPSTEETDLGGV